MQGGNLGSEGDVGSRVPFPCRHTHTSNNLPHRGLHPPHLCAPRAGQSLRRHKIPWPDRPVSVFTKAVNTCRPPTPVLLWQGRAPEDLPVGTGPPELSDPAPPQVPGLISPQPPPAPGKVGGFRNHVPKEAWRTVPVMTDPVMTAAWLAQPHCKSGGKVVPVPGYRLWLKSVVKGPGKSEQLTLRSLPAPDLCSCAF